MDYKNKLGNIINKIKYQLYSRLNDDLEGYYKLKNVSI